jgi:membrane protease YdiL (CAAX protease family)
MIIHNPTGEAVWSISYALFYVLAAVATGMLIRTHPLPLLGAADFTQDFWYAVVFKIGLLLVVPLAVFWRAGYRFSALLPEWRLSGGSIFRILLAYLVGVAVNFSRVKGIVNALPGFQDRELVLRIGVALVLPFFMAGFPEEFFFRGVLQTRLERIWGRLPAVLATSFLFTAWHLPTRFLLAHGVEGQAGNFVSVLMGTGISVTVVGLILAWMWDRNRNLPWLIALHTGIDTLPVLSSLLKIHV